MRHELCRIAYVEDEPDIRELTEMALDTIGGFEVAVWSNGSDALAEIEAFDPDLILLDVMMPEMDGPEILSRLRQMETMRGRPVVFITAKSQRHEVAEFVEMGAAGVITKPYDPMTLSDEVRAFWDTSKAA
ncbi:response regulator [Palleronia sp. LCG004]|uniref:response regulator n=1 Tax=Palleronia sp. LCG004 TaxID=3079304 RepID=UPI002943AD89|nr:response regulator [Palleronia sp. LCG004]WOI58250.1 response regulator [Palleronia sp. LCG004]